MANKEIDLDIRYYRRYPLATHFLLSSGKGVFTAQLVDYSLIGIGVLVDDADAPVGKGDDVSLEVRELGLQEPGKVAWTAKTDAGLRIGVVRTQPLKGNLTHYPLSDILVSLQRTAKTGILEVRHGVVNRKIYVRNGEIVSAKSNYEKDRLGDRLLRKRKITGKQYETAARIKNKTGSSYATILLQMGYITDAGLQLAQQQQTKKIIAGLFLLKDAQFQFNEGPFPLDEGTTCSLSISDVVFREMKKNADVGLVGGHLLNSVVSFSTYPLTLFQALRISPAEKAVLAHIDGKRTIRSIVRLSGSCKGVNPLKLIYALLQARLLKINETPLPSASLDMKKYLSEVVEEDISINEIDRLHSECLNPDPCLILGVTRATAREGIREAFLNLQMKYHPAMHPSLDAPTKEKLGDIFKSIQTAYRMLTEVEEGEPRHADAIKSGFRETPAALSRAAGQIPSSRKEGDGRRVPAPEELRVPESMPATPVTAQSPGKDQNSPAGVFTEDRRAKESAHADTSAGARLRFRDGKVALWEKNFRTAARLFAAAIRLDSSVSEYHYFYGYSLGNLGKHKEAIRALSAADKLKPFDADTAAELGHCYYNLDLPLRAQGCFSKAIEIDPSNKRAQEGLKLTGRKKPKK